MGSFDRWAHRKIRASQRAKQMKKAQKYNPNLNSSQWPKPGINPVTGHTELSAMYDNDGNPIHDEPKGYFKG